jgi:hypothetical protein
MYLPGNLADTVRAKRGQKQPVVFSVEEVKQLLACLTSKDLLMNGVNIREMQELLGHKNVETTMIYTHVLRGLSEPALELHHDAQVARDLDFTGHERAHSIQIAAHDRQVVRRRCRQRSRGRFSCAILHLALAFGNLERPCSTALTGQVKLHRCVNIACFCRLK